MARIFSRVDSDGVRSWYVDYRESGKRHRVRVGPNKTDARAWLERAVGKRSERRLLARVYGEEVREVEPTSLDKFCALYFARVSMLKRSRRNEAYRFAVLVRHFGGSVPKVDPGGRWPDSLTEGEAEAFNGSGPLLTHLRPEDFQRFKAKLAAAGNRPATINRYRSQLLHMYRKAILWGYARKSPIDGMDREKEDNQRTRQLSADEEMKLFHGTDADGRPYLSEPIRSVALFAMNTGMRWGEIISLTRENVDLEGRRVTIQATNSKSKRVRSVPLNDVALGLVVKAFAEGVGRKTVFAHPDGRPVRSMRTAFENALERAEIGNFHFHDLRHTFASRLTSAGVDLNTVRELLGHVSFATTLRYAHLADEAKRTAVDVLTGNREKVGTKRTTDQGIAKQDLSQVHGT